MKPMQQKNDLSGILFRHDRKITFLIRTIFTGKKPLKQKSYFSAET
jgi:hypothetical protein